MGGISSTKQTIFESYAPQFDSVSGISMGSGVLTNICNVSGVGVLASIGLMFATASAANWAGVSMQLEIQIDGGTTKTLPIFVAGVFGGIKNFDHGDAGASAGLGQGFSIPINTRFAVSCRVGVNVTVAAGTETYSATVCRAMKI